MDLHLIVHLVERAGRLFGLALAPALLPPEPSVALHPNFAAFLVVGALALVIAAAWRLHVRIASREATIGAALVVLAVVSSVVCAAYFRDARAPLGRGLLFVALPLWAGLGTSVWAALRKRVPDQPTSTRALAAAVVAGVGLAQLVASASWITSAEQMWWLTLIRNGHGQRALDELTKTNPSVAFARGVVDRCLAKNSAQCTCLAKRADLRVRGREYDGALEDARAAVAACPNDAAPQRSYVLALVAKGDAKQAEEAARAALESSSDARLQYALAIALQGQGRGQEALFAAKKAVELGAGRDAELLVAALLIVTGELDAASIMLTALVAASPNDAEARYNLALIADKKNDYNRARQGYLAALQADPTLANARYNLALLTLRRGVIDEARHHARKFADIAPGDPRVSEIMRRLDAVKAAPQP